MSEDQLGVTFTLCPHWVNPDRTYGSSTSFVRMQNRIEDYSPTGCCNTTVVETNIGLYDRDSNEGRDFNVKRSVIMGKNIFAAEPALPIQ